MHSTIKTNLDEYIADKYSYGVMLDDKRCFYGKVVKGEDVIKKIENNRSSFFKRSIKTHIVKFGPQEEPFNIDSTKEKNSKKTQPTEYSNVANIDSESDTDSDS